MNFKIKNCGPVKDADIDLGRINIVGGHNATGKSSIIEAIKWCIYGEGNSSILNFKAAQENDEKTLFVKCDFKEGDDDIVMIRSIIFDENNNVVNNKFKSFLNDVLQNLLQPIREKRKSLSKKELLDICRAGTEIALSVAKQTLQEVKDAVGINIFN